MRDYRAKIPKNARKFSTALHYNKMRQAISLVFTTKYLSKIFSLLFLICQTRNYHLIQIAIIVTSPFPKIASTLRSY